MRSINLTPNEQPPMAQSDQPDRPTAPVLTPDPSHPIRVRKKNGGRIVLIEPERFDPEWHERIEPEPMGKERVRATPKPEPEASHQQPNDLARMSVDALKELPEFRHVKPGWRTKQDIVAAIIAVREAYDHEDDD